MIGFIIGFIGGIPLIALIWWRIESPWAIQYIKFDNFKSLYVLNPERWYMRSGHVAFRKEYSYSYSNISFKFNPFDYYHYKFWKHNLKKQERVRRECKELGEVISILKSDLENFEKKNTNRMDQAKKEIGILVEKVDKQNSATWKELEILKTIQAHYGIENTIDFRSPVGMGPRTQDKIFGGKQ